jgi:hypothetical protein
LHRPPHLVSRLDLPIQEVSTAIVGPRQPRLALLYWPRERDA